MIKKSILTLAIAMAISSTAMADRGRGGPIATPHATNLCTIVDCAYADVTPAAVEHGGDGGTTMVPPLTGEPYDQADAN